MPRRVPNLSTICWVLYIREPSKRTTYPCRAEHMVMPSSVRPLRYARMWWGTRLDGRGDLIKHENRTMHHAPIQSWEARHLWPKTGSYTNRVLASLWWSSRVPRTSGMRTTQAMAICKRDNFIIVCWLSLRLVSAGPVRYGPRSLQNPKDRDRNRLKPVFFGFNQLQSILFINWLTTGFSRK